MSFYGGMVGIVESCGESYTIQRRELGVFIDGDYREDLTVTELTATGTFQPVKESDKRSLPELYHSEAIFSFHTTTQLKTPQEKNDFDPDRVSIGGELFQVVGETDWGNVGGFYVYLLVRLAV